ncbi:type IV secretion system protein [Roseitranquillus sediminis]|uniref:type IV secretion system protein n=1 Tax=Roseitranquillus sediminis TaxID=2809051 RepID=UPI001D0C246B|nr:type IV secretion system protein [Roseitranquillus sediminis]MBM9595051.1 hypothetical protein [Roseitranquillus sediminis]
MIRMPSRTALALSLTLGLAPAAFAQGVPVIDTTAIAQYIQQLEQMRRDYENQIAQLDNLRSQLESITGPKGIGGILNGPAEQAERRAADSLSAIMDGAMTGVAIPGNAGAITGRIDELKTTFGLADVNTFLSSSLPQDRALATQAGSGMAAVATAEDTYARANASMERVNTLIGKIDDNVDLKASVDYNTRMLAEVAVLLNESLRIQAATANVVGTDALSDARDRAAQRTFMRAGDDG